MGGPVAGDPVRRARGRAAGRPRVGLLFRRGFGHGAAASVEGLPPRTHGTALAIGPTKPDRPTSHPSEADAVSHPARSAEGSAPAPCPRGLADGTDRRPLPPRSCLAPAIPERDEGSCPPPWQLSEPSGPCTASR